MNHYGLKVGALYMSHTYELDALYADSPYTDYVSIPVGDVVMITDIKKTATGVDVLVLYKKHSLLVEFYGENIYKWSTWLKPL